MVTPEDSWIDFDYAMLHLVPHVHLGACEVVGVIMHARTGGFIGMRIALDRDRISQRWPKLDIDLVERELEALRDIASGVDSTGPIGELTASERFHWITAPRSAVLQPSQVHSGRTREPNATLEELVATIKAT